MVARVVEDSGRPVLADFQGFGGFSRDLMVFRPCGPRNPPGTCRVVIIRVCRPSGALAPPWSAAERDLSAEAA